MTDTLHVRRLDVRYRVPEDDGVVRARLDALLARVLDHELEPALVQRGLPVGEEVCVRAVRVPARVRLAAGAAASETLSAAIADGIAAAIAAGGADVVRYRSRRAALVDMALSVAAGRIERAWAWRRIGLWRGGDAPGPQDAAAGLTAALLADPQAIVAVLAQVARAGSLPRLVELVPEEEWSRLARAALAAAGAPPGLQTAVAADVSVAAAQVAARVERASAIAMSSDRPLSHDTAIALGALAWLEVDPAAAAGATAAGAAEIVAALAQRLTDAVRKEPLAAPDASPDPVADDAPDSDALVPALTRFGGLLFLLGVLDELGVPAEVLRSSSPGRRPLRWTLHRLALTLVATEPDDPAALAFAGLAPDAAPPPDDGEPATEDERLALGVLAARVAAHLRQRLDRPEATTEELLDFVCRRRGEIASDPGWIELRLPADEISVELRRAGLDLDPGWVSWLGCVVRFVYG